MKKKTVIIAGIILAMSMFTLCACGDTQEEAPQATEVTQAEPQTPKEDIEGTWTLYGAIIEDASISDNVTEDIICTGEDYEEEFGEKVPDKTLEIDKSGVKNLKDLLEHPRNAKNWEKSGDGQYMLTVEGSDFDKANDRDEVHIYYNIKDKYLLEQDDCTDNDFDRGYTNVYVKK